MVSGKLRLIAQVTLLVCCAAMLLTAGGCTNSKVVALKNQAEFDQTVLPSEKPVFVFFWKWGCASCAMLTPIVNDLANEYDGRVLFVDYQLMTLYFGVTNKELRDKYDVWVYPTAILIVNGEMKKKWVMHYNKRDFRKALDEVLEASSQPASASSACASQPAVASTAPKGGSK